jgi:uncharacterized protein YfaS (alpha-2-macroglobulin family)
MKNPYRRCELLCCICRIVPVMGVLLFVLSCPAGKYREETRAVTVFSGSHVSPGIPAKDLSGYRIAYYQVSAGESAAANAVEIEESDAPFEIVDYGPSGELPAEIKKASLYMVFSQPVVPLARLGETLREDAGFFAIDPPLTGVYRWYGSRLLSFEPDAESLSQRRYTVTLSDTVKSLGGKSLMGMNSFIFETQRLRLLTWNLGAGDYWVSTWNADPVDAKIISLYFSYPVNLDEIAKWIEIRVPGGTLPFTLSRLPKIDEKRYTPEQGALLTVNGSLPLDTDIGIVLLEGARSEPGWLGTKEEAAYSFHTLRPFKFEGVSVRSEARPHTEEGDTVPIALEFSQQVDPENPVSYFSVEGMPELTKENVHFYGSTVVINRLPLEYQKSYRVTISGKVRDLWGRELGGGETVTARVGEANSYAYFLNRGSRMLEAGFPPKVVWETQNPLSLKSLIRGASGPYEQVPLDALAAQDVSKLPKNSKRYFMEDLTPFLGPGGKGSAAMRWEYQTRNQWDGKVNTNNTWLTVQVTDIGLTVRYAYNTVLVWAARLSTGEPAAAAKVELLEGNTVVREGKTDAQGLAVFEFRDGEFVSRFTAPSSSVEGGRVGKGFRIRVSEGGGAMAGGDQVEFIPNDSHNLWRFDVEAASNPFTVEKERAVVFLFTDRGLYRPGETVTFRGIDRTLSRGIYAPYTGLFTIEVSAGYYDGPRIASITGTATANGGSYGSFTLPEKLDPGQYMLRYRRDPPSGAGGQTADDDIQERIVTFTVANFERLRFEASVSFPDIPVYLGDKITGTLSASYLSGGGLSGAPYTWYWTREPAGYNPGGDWQNWRIGQEVYDGRYYLGQGEGVLGPDGSAVISQVVQAEGVEGAVYRYRLEAAVQDAARQEISSRASVLVHPASFYIASRIDAGSPAESLGKINIPAGNPSAWFLASGSPATVSWALVSPEGEPWTAAGDSEVTAQLIRYEWKQSRQQGVSGRINLNWERVEEIAETKSVKLKNGEYSGVIPFTPGSSGQWEVRIRSADARGRTVLTRYTFYVSGGGWVRWGSSDADSITLTPDKSVYAPGETAKLLVRSPLPKGKYLLTLEREGIISEKIIELDGSARTIDIPIEESYVPIVYAAVSSFTVRSGPPENTYYEPDLDKPKGIFGLTGLFVDNETRHYQIEIEPGKGVYRPAEEASVTVKVTHNGEPAAGVEVSFMAVDRGVVDLIDYHVPDPLAYFYNPAHFPLGVRGADSRSLLIDPVTYSLTDLQGGDDNEDNSKLEERKDFRPTAVFEPYLVTGADGTVEVKFGLPDSLTTYRCTAVAAGVDDFGIKEQDLKVSAPLTAVASLPRKLRWRDTGTVSLILTNLEKEAVQAGVFLEIDTVSTENGLWDSTLELDDEPEKKLLLAPGTTAEVSFRVAAVGAGDARLVFTLSSPKVNERIVKTLSVDRPVIYETVTTIGNLGTDNPFIEEGVVLPSLVPEGTGSLSVTLAASRLALLKEAVRYLLDYPYGCIEQRTARLLPLIAFGDHLDAFDLETPVKDPRKMIQDQLEDLGKSQLANGAFPYWPGGQYASTYITLRVAHILALAKQKGYPLPGGIDTAQLLKYIALLESEDRWFAVDPFLKGYSLWVRAMYGERIGTEISTFLRRGDELGISGWSFAGLAAMELGQRDLAVSTRDRVRRFIRPGTRSLDLTDTYDRRGNYWGYDTDRYALALMLYHALSPGDDMTTRLAASLIERQRRGVWTNTASSFWALLAFGRVADAEQEEGADQGFVSRVSLGGAALKETAFGGSGGTPSSQSWNFTEAPVDGLERDVLLPLRIEREGAGRLYYTASLRYGIPAELAGPRDEGIGVFAETFDTEGNKIADGRLIPGKTYTRRITVSTSRDRTWLALRTPVPSGAEIIDAAFVTSSTVPPEAANDAAEDDYYRRSDWEAPPVRFVMDDEIRFHWDFFKAGKKEVEFRFRAVMPGIYPTPPPQAECMYEEEIFGRGAGELIRITEDR